jgi:hypothetical protein
MIRALLACAALLGASGCAGLPSGGRNTVRFVSDPPGALATTSLGPSCTTPCALAISRLDDFEVSFALAGHATRSVRVRSVEQETPGIRSEVGGVTVRFGTIERPDLQDQRQFRRIHAPNPVEVALPRLGGG